MFDTPARPATCWSLMADFANIDAFNPHLEKSALIGGSAPCGLGTERQCDLKGGKGFLRERVIAWHEGQSYTVDIFDSTLPVDDTKTTLGLEALDNGTRLIMETQYRPRWGLAGRVLDLALLRPAFASSLCGVIAGLARKAEAIESSVPEARGSYATELRIG
jgi:hypothetical protein